MLFYSPHLVGIEGVMLLIKIFFLFLLLFVRPQVAYQKRKEQKVNPELRKRRVTVYAYLCLNTQLNMCIYIYISICIYAYISFLMLLYRPARLIRIYISLSYRISRKLCGFPTKQHNRPPQLICTETLRLSSFTSYPYTIPCAA